MNNLSGNERRWWTCAVLVLMALMCLAMPSFASAGLANGGSVPFFEVYGTPQSGSYDLSSTNSNSVPGCVAATSTLSCSLRLTGPVSSAPVLPVGQTVCTPPPINGWYCFGPWSVARLWSSGTGTLTYGGTPITFTYTLNGYVGCGEDWRLCAYLTGSGTDSTGTPVNVAAVLTGVDLTDTYYSPWYEFGALAFGGADTTTLLNQVLQESACVQGQINNPSPTGDAACQAVGSGVASANNAKNTTLNEAACIQGQVNNPSPTGDAACQAVGSGVGAANNAENVALSDVACAEGQVSNPDPNRGDPVCRAVGTAIKTATPPTPPPGAYSDSCTSPSAKTVFDGYAGSTYAKLVTDQPTSQTTAVCYRIDQGSSFQPGGRLDVNAGASAPTPTTDTSYSACSTTSGNTVAGSHPMFTNQLLGLTQQIDTYANGSGDVWLCLEADPVVGTRVLMKQPSAGGPPSSKLDSPTIAAAPPTLGPVGYPSTNCQNGSGNVRALNANVGGAQTWLYGWQESSTKLHLCIRTQGPAQSAGGELIVDATGAPGVQPIGPTLSSNPASCTTTIDHVNTQGIDITLKSSDVTPTPSNPASLCVISPTLPQPVVITAGFTSGAATPHVTWRPDPGTPGGPLG